MELQIDTFECRAYKKAKLVRDFSGKIFGCIMILASIVAAGFMILLTGYSLIKVFENPIAFIVMAFVDIVGVYLLSEGATHYFEARCEETKGAIAQASLNKQVEPSEDGLKAEYEKGYAAGKEAAAFSKGVHDGRDAASGYVNTLGIRRRKR